MKVIRLLMKYTLKGTSAKKGVIPPDSKSALSIIYSSLAVVVETLLISSFKSLKYAVISGIVGVNEKVMVPQRIANRNEDQVVHVPITVPPLSIK